MNMVATANSRTFAADADLVMDAAGGDAGAFESLFRRHGPSAWRLAQAVAATSDDAAKATSDAFARLLRQARRNGEAAAEPFPTALLAAIYRNAATGPQTPRDDERSRPRDRTGTASPPRTTASLLTAELRLARAFRRLPARWRAALWLLESEGFDPATAGLVLGVSGPAALQLAKRGRTGLEQRVVHGGGELPLPELRPVLSASELALPASLAARSEAKWRRSVSADHRWRSPAAGRLIDRSSAPLKACAVGLCAVGIMAAAVVGQHDGSARTTPTSQTAAPGRAAPPSGGDIALGGAPLPLQTPTTTPGDVSAGTVAGTGGGATVVVTAAPTAVGATSRPATPDTPTAGAGPAPTTTTVPVPATAPSTATTIAPVPPTTLPPLPVPTPVVTGPVIQAGVNIGPVAVSLGVGQGACTGVKLAGIQVGCTPPTTGVAISILGLPIGR